MATLELGHGDITYENGDKLLRVGVSDKLLKVLNIKEFNM